MAIETNRSRGIDRMSCYPHHLTDEEKESLPQCDKNIPVQAMKFDLNDPVAWADVNGTLWAFGQYADGTWYKTVF